MLKHWVNRSTMEIRSIALKKCDSLPAPRHSQLALPLVLVAHIAIFASNSGVVELYVGNVQHSKAAMWANSTRDGASSEALTYSNCRVNWRHVGVILSQSWGKADNVTYPINWAGSTFGMSNAFSIFQKFLCSISLGPQERCSLTAPRNAAERRRPAETQQRRGFDGKSPLRIFEALVAILKDVHIGSTFFWA